MNYTTEQLFQVISSLGIGFSVGLFYDVHRLITRGFARWLIALLDVLWGILAAGWIFFCLLLVNWGQLRIYTLLFILAGFIFWWFFVSPGLRPILGFLGRGIFCVVKWFVKAVRFVLLMIAWPLIKLSLFLGWLLALLGRLFNFWGRILRLLVLLFLLGLRKIKALFPRKSKPPGNT